MPPTCLSSGRASLGLRASSVAGRRRRLLLLAQLSLESDVGDDGGGVAGQDSVMGQLGRVCGEMEAQSWILESERDNDSSGETTSERSHESLLGL